MTTTRSGVPSPGGASFANLLAVASIKAELDTKRFFRDFFNDEIPDFESIRLDRAAVNEIAQQLAEASVRDPSNLEAVENLAVLFAYLGDESRRSLALDIAARLKARTP